MFRFKMVSIDGRKDRSKANSFDDDEDLPRASAKRTKEKVKAPRNMKLIRKRGILFTLSVNIYDFDSIEYQTSVCV